MISTFKFYSFLPDPKKVGEEIGKIYETGKENKQYNSIPEFVEKIGVSVNSFHKWKRGECFPDIDSLKEIVKVSTKKVTLDDILIPDANLVFDYEKYPQFLDLKFDYSGGFDKISDVVYKNIEEYKKHCELVNYLVQKELFAFRDSSKYFLKYSIDRYLSAINEKYGFDYRFNKEKHKDILCFYKAEYFKNFFSDYFSIRINSKIQFDNNEHPSSVIDNSVTDAIFSLSRLCKCNNLEYQLKIFELLDDCYKFCAYASLTYIDNPKTRGLVDYLKNNSSYNDIYELTQELLNTPGFKEQIEKQIDPKTEKERVLKSLKDLHEFKKCDYSDEKELLNEHFYFSLMFYFISLLNYEELVVINEDDNVSSKDEDDFKDINKLSNNLRDAILEVIYG